MKRIGILVCICLITASMLSACNGLFDKAVPGAEKDRTNAHTQSDTAETEEESAELQKSEDSAADDTNESVTTTSLNESGVSARVQLYEGCYFDSSTFGDSTRADYPKTYCEINVLNITDTSFDFIIDEVTVETDEKEQILPRKTAVFIHDGMEAVYQDDDMELTFTFPDYHKAYPAATDMEITGYNKLEGKTYNNNCIPGHEFG